MNKHTMQPSLLFLGICACSGAAAADLPVAASVPSEVTINEITSNYMEVISTKTNNVIKWDSFDIASGNTVCFDSHNYLNIVTGSSASVIDGTLQGFGSVYLVNPHGIATGLNSSIQVEKFGFITAKPDEDMAETFVSTGNLTINTEGMGKVTLLGTIKTNNLLVDAGQIIIRDITSVKDFSGYEVLDNSDEDVNIQLTSSTGRIDIGAGSGSDSVDLEEDYGFSGDEYIDHTGAIAISTAAELESIVYDPAGDYFLTNNIDLGTITQSINGSREAFSGTFDGAFNTITYDLECSGSSSAVTKAGLFSALEDAIVENLKITGSVTVDGAAEGSMAGGLAGEITGGTLSNVEIEYMKIIFTDSSSQVYAGALAGMTSSSTQRLELDDVRGYLSEESENALSSSGVVFGSLIGLVQDPLNVSGLTGGISPGSVAAVGESEYELSLSDDLALNYAALDADSQYQYLETPDGGISSIQFYDPFYVENFEVESFSAEDGYDPLTDNDYFELANFADSEETDYTNGVYSFSLESSTKDTSSVYERGFYFVNTSTSGEKSTSFTGRALVSLANYDSESETGDYAEDDLSADTDSTESTGTAESDSEDTAGGADNTAPDSSGNSSADSWNDDSASESSTGAAAAENSTDTGSTSDVEEDAVDTGSTSDGEENSADTTDNSSALERSAAAEAESSTSTGADADSETIASSGTRGTSDADESIGDTADTAEQAEVEEESTDAEETAADTTADTVQSAERQNLAKQVYALECREYQGVFGREGRTSGSFIIGEPSVSSKYASVPAYGPYHEQVLAYQAEQQAGAEGLSEGELLAADAGTGPDNDEEKLLGTPPASARGQGLAG